MLIAFIIHKLLKLASGPQFSKSPGLSQLRLLRVGLAGVPLWPCVRIRRSAQGPWSLEMKTKDSRVGGFRAALGGWAFSPLSGSARWMRELSLQLPSRGYLLCPTSTLRTALCSGPLSDLPVTASGTSWGSFPMKPVSFSLLLCRLSSCLLLPMICVA